MPKAFPAEFRRDGVNIARKGESLMARIAKEFRICDSCVGRWVRMADTDDGARPGVTASESAEVRDLKRHNRVLQREVEILLRAAPYFAKDIALK